MFKWAIKTGIKKKLYHLTKQSIIAALIIASLHLKVFLNF